MSEPPAPTRTLRSALVVGYGFIGRHVARALVRRGVATTVLTRSAVAGAELPGARFVAGSACERALLDRALHGAEHVFFTAGGLFAAESNADPIADTQLALPPLLTVLEALRARPGVGLTFLSSGGVVYGNPRYLPVDEAHPTNPISSYGILKLTAEKYVSMYAELYGLGADVLRCSNVYGEGQPSERGQGAVAAFLARLQRREAITLFGDGSVVRDFLYVGDLVDAMIGLAERPHGGLRLCNVGSGEATRIDRLIVLLSAITGLAAKIESKPARGFDVGQVVLEVSALRRHVDFRPLSIEDGLRRTIAAAARGAASDSYAPTRSTV